MLEDTSPGFQPFGFAGGIWDEATGLVRFGARDYDAVAGRWTAKDPVGLLNGGSNPYAYADGDPLSFVDPDGQIPILPIIIGIGAGFAFDFILDLNGFSGDPVAAYGERTKYPTMEISTHSTLLCHASETEPSDLASWTTFDTRTDRREGCQVAPDAEHQ